MQIKSKNKSVNRLVLTVRKGRAETVKLPKNSRFAIISGKAADLIQKLRSKNFRLFFEILVRLRRNFLTASIASCNV
ncbi:hypothetical protein C7S15_4301 [Burkholderia cepacia]|nr:hypothetical protein [Burkholderia cepacia]